MHSVQAPYLVSMVRKRGLQVTLPRHRHQGVLHVVGLKEALQDLAGTQCVHVQGGQHQDVLQGSRRQSG